MTGFGDSISFYNMTSQSSAVMPPSSSSLHGFLAQTRGASVVSTRAEKTRQVRVSAPKILGQEDSPSAVSAREAHDRQMRANNVNAAPPRPPEPETIAVPKIQVTSSPGRGRVKKAKLAKVEVEPEPDQADNNSVARPVMSINFELPIGIITNLVHDIRVSDNILSVWGPSGATERFRPAPDTELVVSFHGGRYNCWSPGIYIDNPNYECSVSVFIIKDEE